MKKLSTLIANTSFKDEYVNIIDYMIAAFEGEPEDKIRTVMDSILTIMMNDIKDNRYVMVSDSPAVDESIKLGNLIRSINDDKRIERIMAYCEISAFNPIGEKSLNTVRQNKLWESTRRKIANIFHKALPNLTPVGLNELLEDENASTPTQPDFNGLLIETVGAFPFHKRVSASSLRYDQQEQGNHWVNVVAGAIVCHYHTFLEIKQNHVVQQAIRQIRLDLENDRSQTFPENAMHTMMVDTYSKASLIHD